MRAVQTHSVAVRVTHWLMALAILALIGSGWRIYNASPIFDFRFPEMFTLGGDVEQALALHNDPGVASAIAWHFAAMWLLALSYLGFVLWNTLSGHFWRDFLPVGPRSFWRDFSAALRFRLDHRLGEYNAVQRVAYWGVLGAVAMMLLSGAAIWKPVQTYPLETVFGGFQGARIVHFMFMAAIALFIVIHVALVILVPKTFVAMTLGRASAEPHGATTTERDRPAAVEPHRPAAVEPHRGEPDRDAFEGEA
ncbi:MAG TPA: cytochrome b/b6 domain-containing protein [Rhodopila sp.]|nr:cytochrome b/b6 domain-containing protein [Rhodopila sp.]